MKNVFRERERGVWSSSFAPEEKKRALRKERKERERERENHTNDMSSGVVPNDACKPAFDKVRLGKIKYVTFKIDDKAEKTEVCEMGETKVRAMRHHHHHHHFFA